MKTKLSSKGQVVLPGPIRKRLGLIPGETLDVVVDEEERIVLSRRMDQANDARVITDPVTGLPVLVPGRERSLTSDQVTELLSDFP